MRLVSTLSAHLGPAIAAAMLVCGALAFEAGRGGEAEATPVVAMAEPMAETPAPEPALPIPALRRDAPDIPPADTHIDESRPVLAVIIDDLGLNQRVFDRLLEIDAPVTFAILPYGERAPAMARQAAEAGREVFLHMPMEPVGLDDPGPMALTRHLGDAELARRAEWALSRVPGATGFNNHMGSALTADADRIGAALNAFSGRELIFVDSVTSPRSAAAREAARLGLVALRRDVFLDNTATREAVDARLDEALDLAAARGWAIAIGHPYPATLEALETLAERAEAAGVEIVPVAAIAERKARPGPAS